MKVFAAIDVGSYELAMKIYEIATRGKIKLLDHLVYPIELGTDTYNTGKISFSMVDEMCNVLNEFREIMNAYHVDAYKAYGTSAIRETENTIIVLDQIRNRTGINVEVISNSEQRFLDYKSIALKGGTFNKIIGEGTAILDIGGGSIQISLFDHDTLITTQNMRLGVLRMRERLQELESRTNHYEDLISDLANPQLQLFKKMYLKNRVIKNMIVVDDYVSTVLWHMTKELDEPGFVSCETFLNLTGDMRSKNIENALKSYKIPQEKATLLYHSAILVKNMIEITGATMLWAPGVSLCDGIVYEYAEKNKLITIDHDFEKDILACATDMGKRYMTSRRRSETVENIALSIFDAMKKVHGLSKRERLLLQISAKLNDCGKYISLMHVGECSYNIVRSTEIIGLSHLEREMVAHIVKYNRMPFSYYNEISKETVLDKKSYLIIAKLTAILRMATGLDRSHKQKCRNLKTSLKGDVLTIIVDTMDDITLEKGLLNKKSIFFEEVFSIKVDIRQKRKL